jgi:hypothetical protein
MLTLSGAVSLLLRHSDCVMGVTVLTLLTVLTPSCVLALVGGIQALAVLAVFV